MAFTDALFDGRAELDGVVARRVDTFDHVKQAWRQDEIVPVVAMAEDTLLRQHRFGALVEVDPRAEPQVFGLGERPVAIARGTCRALGLE